MKPFRILLIAAVVAMGMNCGEKLATEVPYPDGYRHWTHVKSLELKDKHPLFKDFGGVHHVYVNDTGIAALKSGQVFPDGSTIVFDLLDVKSNDAATAEGSRKVLAVMYKNTSAFASTKGWGFEGFKGDTRERVVNGKHASCFGCHATEGKSDYVYSKYRE